MASLEQVDQVRVHVGSAEASGIDDDVIYEVIDRLGSVQAAALEILRSRRAELLTGPASFSTTGYAESNSETIKALTEDIAALQAEVDLGGGVGGITTVTAVRPDRCGR